MPPLKKIVLRLFVGAMVATVTTPALALVCLEDHCNDPLKSCSGHNEWRSQT
ncbi:hypothetical protein ACUX5Z_24560 [Salmonella enterica]|uniref:hypothetical protein n=1 Tax=Salmonella TaxID=590 RepID=UPI00192A4405